MNGELIFDNIGSLTAGMALIFRYVILYYFLKKFLGFKYRNIVFIIAVSVLTACKLLLFKAGMPVYQQILTDNVLWLILICVICKGNLPEKLYAFVIQASATILTSIAFISIDYKISALLLNNFNMANKIDIVFLLFIDILRESANLVILYVFLKFISKFMTFEEKFLSIYEGIYLLVPNFAVYSMAAAFYIVQEVKVNNRTYYLLNLFPDMYYIIPFISAGLIISMIITAFIFREMIEGEEVKHNNMLMQQQFRLQLNHSKSIEELYSGIRSIKHDLSNHIVCLKYLAEDNDAEGIKKYLSNMENYITGLGTGIKTGNSISDAILNEKYNIAKNQGIEFEYDCLLPEDIFVEPMDLCIILSNSLDNAIEACMRIKDSSLYKFINLKVKILEDYILFEVSNSMDETFQYRDYSITSIKKDSSNHGIGISNIKRTVEKYDGVVDIIVEKSKFTINIMLKRK